MKYTKAEIIGLLKSFASNKGHDWITAKEFFKESGISRKQFFIIYTRWNLAVAEAGLRVLDKRGRPDRKKGFTKEELISIAKELSLKLKKDNLSLAEFSKNTRISYNPIKRLFRDWESFLKEAGLHVHPLHKLKIPDEDLFKDFIVVYKTLDSCPSYNQFAQQGHFNIATYERRFKGFKSFRKQAITYGINNGLIPANIQTDAVLNKDDIVDSPLSHVKPFTDRVILGERIDFRGLIHAPINEMGVVFLFGMVAEELGFVIESIQAGFPDCEGKRRLNKNRWQSVRIEFEYVSSNFLVHRHDVSKCDLIVCWKHDWNNCPLEVISLHEFISEKIKKSTKHYNRDG